MLRLNGLFFPRVKLFSFVLILYPLTTSLPGFAATDLPNSNLPLLLQNFPTGNPFVVPLGGQITTGANGIAIQGNNTSNWILSNFGTVSSNSTAIQLSSNSTVTNAGSIIGLNGTGLSLLSGGTVTNEAGATISGGASGILIAGAAATINNAGTISSTIGPTLSFTNNLDNTVINTGTVIAGSSGIAVQFGNGKDQMTMVSGSIFGNISQGDGVDTFIMQGGQINGSIAQGGSLDNFLMSGGTITGDVNDGDFMTMTGGTIGGSVNLNIANNVFTMSGGLINGNVNASFQNDTLNISGGRINGMVNLTNGNNRINISGGQIGNGISTGTGNDIITWTGAGIVNGAIHLGTGNNTMTLRNLNDSHLSAVTVFDGGVGSTGLLQLDAVQVSGPSRFQNWEVITLSNNTQLTMNSNLTLGDVNTQTGSLTIDSSSVLLAGNGQRAILAADPNALVSVTNAGTFDLSQGLARATDSLTIAGNYLANNARLIVDSILGNDNSASDKLIFAGGFASGDTSIEVNNLNGQGAATLGNGILVVEALNNAQTSSSAFRLSSPVLAGPYEYYLAKGSIDGSNPDNWYLRSSLQDAGIIPVDGVIPTIVVPPGQQPFFIPSYRQEVSLYSALPSMSMLYGRTMLDTLQQRVGDETRLTDFSQRSYLNGAWTRVVNQDGDWKNGSILDKGPDFNYHFLAVQAGLDLYRQQHSDGSRDYVGVYGAYGDADSKVKNFNGLRAGKNTFNAYTAGAYWTHFGVSEWYLDGVIQNNWYDYRANSGRVANLTPDGYQFGASLEGGYPFKLTQSLRLEPQGQLVYQTLSMDDATDGISQVKFKRTNAYAGRLGLRLLNTWFLDSANSSSKIKRKMSAWLRVSGWHDSDSNSTTLFSSASGYVPIASYLKGNWLQTDLGLTGQITSVLSVYGTFGRDFYLNGHGNAYNAIAGLRVNL